MANQTYYEILGINPETLSGLDDDQIEKLVAQAFRKKVRQIHPDAAGTSASGSTGEQMAELVNAKDTLSDPQQRKAYNDLITPARPSERIFTQQSTQQYRDTRSNYQKLIEHLKKSKRSHYGDMQFTTTNKFSNQELLEIVNESKDGIYQTDVHNWILNRYPKLDASVLEAIVAADRRGYAPTLSVYDLLDQPHLTSEHLITLVSAQMHTNRRAELYSTILKHALDKVNPALTDAMIAQLRGTQEDVKIAKMLIDSGVLTSKSASSIVETTKDGFSSASIRKEILKGDIHLDDLLIKTVISTIKGKHSDVAIVKELTERAELTEEQKTKIRENSEGGPAADKVEVLVPAQERGFLKRIFDR